MTTRAFVDAIEGDLARVMLGQRSFELPVALLPGSAREGTWIEIAIAIVDPPDDDTEALRRDLARDDPGGDIEL